MSDRQNTESLLQENQRLRNRLEELEETLHAIRSGEVDALIISGPAGEQVYSLRGALEPYRIMVETMSEGAVTLAQNGTIFYCNNRFAELVKTPQENIVAIPLYHWVAAKDWDKFDAMLTQGRKGIVREELELQADDGTQIPAHLSMCPLPDSVGKGIAVVITDLTEIKQAEQNIQKRVKELRVFYYLSELAERDDLALDNVYQELANILPDSWQYPEIACARIAMGEKEFHTGNFRTTPWIQTALIKVQGVFSGKIEVAYLEQKSIQDEGPFLKEERRLLNAVAERIGHIAGRKQAEEELRKYHGHLEDLVQARTDELEAANKDLESFAYSVSHDLRAPLRAIDGFSRILLKQYEDTRDDEGKRYLNMVRDNTKRMSQLIDDILAFSRMGRLGMAAAEINMEALVRSVHEDIKLSFVGREVTLTINQLSPCRGDLAMLRQVWANLLDNAVKFTRPKPAALIEIGGYNTDRESVYYIKDNGAGFDMQYADKLFGVFQRLHSVDEFEGTGIGLAIVKRIITRHGGRVWAEGKINGGAIFYFALPL